MKGRSRYYMVLWKWGVLVIWIFCILYENRQYVYTNCCFFFFFTPIKIRKIKTFFQNFFFLLFSFLSFPPFSLVSNCFLNHHILYILNISTTHYIFIINRILSLYHHTTQSYNPAFTSLHILFNIYIHPPLFKFINSQCPEF